MVKERNSVPRSDGCVLNVDFENYVDHVVGLLNAGVRQLGDPFTEIPQKEVTVLKDPERAFSGKRCGYVLTDQRNQRGQILLQRRFDAPEVENEVVELVFRPVYDQPVDLEDFVVWSGMGYQSGRAGVVLYAHGRAPSGTYYLDVEEGGDPPSRLSKAVTGLPQSEWIRVVLARNREKKTVDLWVGPPGQEKWVGQYGDLDSGKTIGRVQVGDLSQARGRGSGHWDHIRVGQRLIPGQTVSPPETLRHVGKEYPALEYPLRIGSEKQLFVDDGIIESRHFLKRTFHPASKHPQNPLLLPEKPWERDGVWFVPYGVIQERPEGPFRVWYGCYRRSETKLTFSCLAESPDGLEWVRPHLGLFEFGGTKENNIVWQGRAIKPNYDPRDPDPARRYKGMTRVAGFTPMFSPDGVRWTMASAPAVTQAYDATGFFWDPGRGKWIASCKIFWDGKRARGYAESQDFVNWTDTYLMLSADEKDHPEDQLYAMRIFRYESVYVGLVKVYHVATDRCDLQLAFSRNALHWQRPYRIPFLSNSSVPGAYDYGNIDDAGDPIVRGEELWFYYGGRSVLHNEKPADTNGSLGLATLRQDGFISLDAGPRPGILLTRPLELYGSSLYLNADAQGGEIRVEVVEGTLDSGTGPLCPLPSFTKTDCSPITTDSVGHKMAWTRSPRLERLQGKPVRLRFYLQNASLYSFWVE